MHHIPLHAFVALTVMAGLVTGCGPFNDEGVAPIGESTTTSTDTTAASTTTTATTVMTATTATTVGPTSTRPPTTKAPTASTTKAPTTSTTKAPTTSTTKAPTTTSTTTAATTTSTTERPPVTVPPAPGPFDPSGSGCSPAPGALPDGIWYGFPADSTESTLEFDLACWFAGEAAVKAASEDGQESPPPNDYYIRNENHTNRTLMVAEDTPVIWYPNSAPTSETSTTWSKWRLATGSREIPPGIWVKIEHGSVVSIQEQWVP